MAVFWSSLTSCFPGVLLIYFLNDIETVPVSPIITGIIYYYTIWMSLVSGLFYLVLLLNQLRLEASHCNTFRIMFDVPSIAGFCSESIECFPGTVSKFFLNLLVTIPVAPIITSTIVHFGLHIRHISIYINSCILTSLPLPFAQLIIIIVIIITMMRFLMSLFFVYSNIRSY